MRTIRLHAPRAEPGIGSGMANLLRSYRVLRATSRPVDARPFVVRAARSNVSIPVSTDMTIANALSKVGIEVPLSCEVGVCGTCLTRVISGTPDHLDTF